MGFFGSGESKEVLGAQGNHAIYFLPLFAYSILSYLIVVTFLYIPYKFLSLYHHSHKL